MLEDLLEKVKKKCGIADIVTVYDSDAIDYINDAIYDMKTAGVPEDILPDLITESNTYAEGMDPRTINTIALYVKAYIGEDRSDTDKYLKMYHDRVSKLSILSSEKGAPTAASSVSTESS